ncbi:glycoside hydrolase family 71/99-like protein [Pedobacter jeongneungensis]
MRKISLMLLSAVILTAVGCKKTQESEDVVHDSFSQAKQVVALASPPGDVVGKLVVGYQAWFGCLGDGSPFNSWKTWGPNPPSPGHINVEMWPDVREYTTTYQTGFANLGNGQPAKLFTSYSQQVVNTHFLWMRQNGIDCAALQRFGSALAADPRDLNWRNGNVPMVKAAAETYGRKFFIEYDISGWTNFQSEIKTDWTTRMQTHTSSTAYAKQNGKPVVSLWGIGVSGRPGNNAVWTDVINWFKTQGCYVIIGVKRDWRNDATNMSAYNQANMIQPWTVGSMNGIAGANNYVSTLSADFAYCNSHNQDYQPVAFPGFAWSNWHTGAQNEIPRLHGDFLWRQFYNIRNNNIPSVKVAMFDEYNEGTAIAKAAENASMKPSNQYFLTLDADGVACSSDFYLRLTRDGAKMIKGQIPLTANHPTSHQ